MLCHHVREAVQAMLPEAQEFLCDLIRLPSTSGNEDELMRFLDGRLRCLDAQVEKISMDDSLRDDPDYSDPVPDIAYDGRFSLRVTRPGTGGGRTLLFNAHTDVVPPSEGMEAPWEPRVEDGVVFGRGACDDKGPIAALFLLYRVLDRLGVSLEGDLTAHLVVEEENGGNGSLAMARAGETADGCIVLEPSDRSVFTSIRGAVWFRLGLHGKAGHSGQAGQTRSALLMARDAIAVLEEYHARLLAGSRGFPLFDPYPNPMPITFGRLYAGNWPAAAPSKAVLEGVLGFLPNKTKEQVCEEMRQALEAGDSSLKGNTDLHFMYRHDCSVVEPAHELPTALLSAGQATGAPLAIDAMTASCDAWFYNNQLGIPTVVYGPGTLKVAHSSKEQISMSQIAEATEVLVHLVLSYCGS